MCELGVEMVSGNKDDSEGVARATIKKSSSRPHFLLFMSKILELLVMRLFFFPFQYLLKRLQNHIFEISF